MRVAISTRGEHPESLVHPQFGRCEWFVIFDEAPELVKVIKNSNADLPTGAGIGCADDLVRQEVKAVIAGQFGPKACEVLKQAGVAIYLAPSNLSAQDAYTKFLSGGLQKMEIKKF